MIFTYFFCSKSNFVLGKGALGSEAPALYMEDTCIHDPTVSEDEAEEEG